MADYIDAAYAHHFPGPAAPSQRNAAVHDLMRAQEITVIQPLLDYFSRVDAESAGIAKAEG